MKRIKIACALLAAVATCAISWTTKAHAVKASHGRFSNTYYVYQTTAGAKFYLVTVIAPVCGGTTKPCDVTTLQTRQLTSGGKFQIHTAGVTVKSHRI